MFSVARLVCTPFGRATEGRRAWVTVKCMCSPRRLTIVTCVAALVASMLDYSPAFARSQAEQQVGRQPLAGASSDLQQSSDRRTLRKWQPPSAATRAIDVADSARTPMDLFGPLYEAVQRAKVFPDNKTFVDLVPLSSPASILGDFDLEKPRTRGELSAFVFKHFRVGEVTTQPSMRKHIKALWSVLAKAPMAVTQGSSSLQLPNAYVVAGGRFSEMYYWDSYFTMLGLKADGEQPLVESMLGNFVSLVDRYGHVPNGTRSYYLTRSQPPFLSLMMDLSDVSDPALDMQRLNALKTEYAYWMAGEDCLGNAASCQHVVRMPDGTNLNRYWDARETPRDESYTLDVATAEAATSRSAAQVYRDLRAGAESGWDFSSRWLKDGKRLSTIRTTEIVPIDLNSLLWNLELSIARRCGALGDTSCSADFERRGAIRRSAIAKYLWNSRERRFGDWDMTTGALTPSISAAALYPLFVGLATDEQADDIGKLTRSLLLSPGGLRTTTTNTGEQWDEPNGWAPLLWVAVRGLDRYRQNELADDLARRWVRTSSQFYACNGRMVEKYDVERGKAGGGGEYPVQDGFGWTNGVTRVLLDRPGIERSVVSSCPARP